MIASSFLFFWSLLCSETIRIIYSARSPNERPTEQERVELWHKRNTWPPNWQPESDVQRAFLAEREKQIMALPYSSERWENWLQFTQSRMVPRFTEFGFKVVKTPAHVHEKLYKKVKEKVANYESIPMEGEVDVIYSDKNLSPKFINMEGLDWEVINDLKSIHEEWAGGIELRPTSAYGVRLYQNGSSLVMHYDRSETHVISSIVHIAHEYDDDNEPWPIEIEDHDGNLHVVSLQEGEMLHYESARNLHGRMTEFKGKYYGSIFLHYQPVDRSIWNFTHEDVIANVPPHWRDDVIEGKGELYAGACITVPGRLAAGSPPMKKTLSATATATTGTYSESIPVEQEL